MKYKIKYSYLDVICVIKKLDLTKTVIIIMSLLIYL
jgi:hypothetical protein